MDINSIILKITVYTIPFLLAVVVHELAHGLVAKRLGDSTAYMLGRLTLNPAKHIDPLGTVIVPLVLLLTSSPFLFGWAKPVPVNTRNLKNPKKSMAIVAAAGPVSNLLMAIAWALLFSLNVNTQIFGSLSLGVYSMASFGVIFNVLLAVFNMIPMPPLDGGRVAVGVLPNEQGHMLAKLEPYGMLIVFALLMTNILFPLINPIISGISGLIFSLVGVG